MHRRLVFLVASLICAAVLAPSERAEAAEHLVEVFSNNFQPGALTIQAGDTVRWENRAGFHDVTADNGSFVSGPPANAPWTFRHTFNSAGSFNYFCSVHGGPGLVGMAGTINVVGNSSSGTVVLSSTTYSASEGGNVTLTLRRLSGSSGPASVRVTTVSGSAAPGLDYADVDRVVNWGAGDGADKSLTLTTLQDGTTEGDETFTVRLSQVSGAALGTPSTATVTIQDDDGATPACVRDANTLCLVGSRFKATLTWENQFNGTSGVGGAIPSTDLSGFFWFTDPNNVEIILKVLDFGDVIKVFYGQLTDLRFRLTIVDTQTGAQKVYENGPNNCGAIDQAAFAKYGIDRERLARQFVKLARGKGRRPGSCESSPTALCLLDNRFRLELTWRNQFNGQTGSGGAVPLSNLTGIFYFTDPANAELMVKTLDFGNEQILILWGALSDLEYHIKVTDTTTGAVKTYDNPGGQYCGGIDRDAF